MEIYVLRHGIAADAAAGQPDSERAITPEGRRKLRGVLKTARRAEFGASLILTSPYRRAVQTAQLAAEALDYQGEILRTNVLTPSSGPDAVWDEIRAHKDESGILLVGHEPLFSALTAYLLGCPQMEMDFKKGAIVRLDLERFTGNPKGVLKWMLVPKLADV